MNALSWKNTSKVVGVIGGTGLYELDGFNIIGEFSIETPFGKPSDKYLCGHLDEVPLVFLPRHGRGHRLSPSEVNYKANIYGMKKLGVTHIISVSAVGSMKEDIFPGKIVVVDQFIDRTYKRENTFFSEGIVAHISMADPVCPDLFEKLYEAAKNLDIPVQKGGTYICIEGPQFSTRAESKTYRALGVDVIGMTNMPEARLAREAEIAYATIALATDYDCWHETEEDVTAIGVMEVLSANVMKAKNILRAVIPKIEDKPSIAHCALKNAIVTNPSRISLEVYQKLEHIICKYINKNDISNWQVIK